MNQTACEACPAGKYGLGQCQACPPPNLVLSDRTACGTSPCAAGRMCAREACAADAECTACLAGHVSTGGDCTSCDIPETPSLRANADQSACEACLAQGDTVILHCHSLPFLGDLHCNIAVTVVIFLSK